MLLLAVLPLLVNFQSILGQVQCQDCREFPSGPYIGVYSLVGEEGKESAVVFGDCGDEVGQFYKPAGIVVDDFGNSIVVDSGNNRLQLINSDFIAVGCVEVSYSKYLLDVDKKKMLAGGEVTPEETRWNLL